MWYFKLLRTFICFVFELHCLGPDAAGDAANDGIFRINTVGEEVREVRRKFVDVHPARQIIFDKGEAVGEGEGQLADGIGTCFSDVIARNGDAVEVAHVVVDEILLDVAHHT